MEAVDLWVILSDRRPNTSSATHHVKKDLVELRRLQPVQTEAVRVLGDHVVGKSPEHGQQANLSPVILEPLQPNQQLVQVGPHDRLQPPHRLLREHFGHGGAPGPVQVVVGRGARGLREAKDLDHARILVPAAPAGGHELGEEGRVVDVQFVRGDAHNVAVSGVHVADAEEVLAAAEEVMVELAPEGHGREAGAGELGERVQGQAVGVEEGDVEGEGGGDGRQWPGDDKVEGGHGVPVRFSRGKNVGTRGLFSLPGRAIHVQTPQKQKSRPEKNPGIDGRVGDAT